MGRKSAELPENDVSQFGAGEFWRSATGNPAAASRRFRRSGSKTMGITNLVTFRKDMYFLVMAHHCAVLAA
jgi:hypothetical protein